MNLFSKKFAVVLEADQDEAQSKPETDREAMAQQLDTAKPSDFDAPAQIARAQQVDHNKVAQIKQLGTWIQEIDNFIEFLNGTTENSIQTQLHTAPCDTMFEDIARRENTRSARLAAELSSLSESFKGYMISSND
jgi:hypothetical protein